MPNKPLTYIDKNKNLILPTEEGINVLLEYYNKKYPDRGQIHRVSAWAVNDMDFREDSIIKMQKTYAQSATPEIESLRKKHQIPLKIMLTFFYPDSADYDRSAEFGFHSLPLLLTDSKLILLRSSSPTYYGALEMMAKNLGVSFVRQVFKHENNKQFLPTSIQADQESCHILSAAILKDLTGSDMKEIAKFENGYIPLPKMLKYSQSQIHISQNFPELLGASVKKDGKTLGDYVEEHSIYNANTKTKVGTRIGSKMNEMKNYMKILDSKEEVKDEVRVLEIMRLKQTLRSKL